MEARPMPTEKIGEGMMVEIAQYTAAIGMAAAYRLHTILQTYNGSRIKL